MPVTPKKKVLFHGAPLSECRAFWITECGWVRRVGSAPDGVDEGWSTSWALGGMVNVSRRSAVGITGFVRLDFDKRLYYIGPAARYRYWLWPVDAPREWISLEVSAGPLYTLGHERYLSSSEFPSGAYVDSPGFLIDAMLNLADVVSFTVRRESIPLRLDEPGGPVPTDGAWYLGVRFDSYPGAIIGAVMALVAPFAGLSFNFGS